MRLGAFLQPIRIAGLLVVALVLLGAEAGSGGTELEVPLTHDCDGAGDPWSCQLTVTVQGNGSVSSDDQQIVSCRQSSGDCSGTYTFFGETGPPVSLTAVPDNGWHFVDWSGSECEGAGTTCRIQMDHDRTVTALFQQTTYTLTVTVAGSGNGTVSSNPAGINNCTGTCSATYASGTQVQLTATPTSPSTFGGWSGDCSGTGGCSVAMTTNRNVSATFNAPAPVRRTLTVSVTGTGKVTGPGIDCPTDCSEQYDNGTSVQLTASPGSGWTWGGWGGAAQSCGTATTCTVAMSADRNVTATFNAPAVVKRTLTVSVTGTGNVTGPGIDCPTDCTEQYDSGTNVLLTATPGSNMTLTGWGGDCSGTQATCSLTMTANKSVTATFASGGGGGGTTSYALTVTANGNGTVTGPGISCPGDCTQSFPAGTQVALTATPAANHTHQWGGDCSAAGSATSCSLAMTAARSASATFRATVTPQGEPVIDGGKADTLPDKRAPDGEQLIVVIDGTGKVTSAAADRVTAGVRATKPINCGTTGSGAPRFDCYGEYRAGETLTLSAKAAPGYVFKRWTGACAGNGPKCRVVTRDARTTTAVFEQGGTGAAVAALLKPPNLRVRWQSSVGAGNLVLRGSTSLPANARVDMRRPGGGPLATLKLKLGGGSFRQTLALRQGALRGGAKLFPGGFTVAMTGRSAGLKLPLQMQTISVPAPVEGVVRRAFKSRTQNGKAVTRLPAGAKEAWANFRFETQPRLGQKLTVRWYWPDGKPVGEVRKSNRPVVSSYLRLATGLPSGLWVAELRAGKRVVQRLSIRIG